MDGVPATFERPLSTHIRPTALTTSGTRTGYSSVALDEIELIDSAEIVTQPRSRKLHLRRRWKQYGLKGKDSTVQAAQRKTLGCRVPTWIPEVKVSWRLLGRRLVARVLPLFLLSGLIVLLALMSYSPALFFANSIGACNPDGDFSVDFQTYTPWKRSGFFAINIKAGSFTFWQAKFLDVSWDIVIGRGGQAFLAVFTYIVFTKGLTRAMENSAVPHDTYKAITLQNNTFMGVVRLSTNLMKTSDLRTRGMLIWTMLSASFVLLFPTWLSAMTGYVSDVNPYIMLKDSSTVPVSNFQPLIYTIHDGERLGRSFKNDTRVTAPWASPGLLDVSNSYLCGSPYGVPYSNYSNNSATFIQYRNGTLDFPPWTLYDCQMLWAVSYYVFNYGFFATSNTNSTFQLPSENSGLTEPILLDFPSLNVSASFAIATSEQELSGQPTVLDYSWPYGRFWQYPGTNKYAFQPGDPRFYDPTSDTMYTLGDLRSHGACQQATGTILYRWGFSFLLLYLFVIIFLVWTIGLWIFYLDSVLHSRLGNRDMGYERAALDLARSMYKKLDATESEMCSNSELREYTKEDLLTYVDLPYDHSVPSRWLEFRRGFSFPRWLSAEKWWLAAMLVSTGVWICSWFFGMFSIRLSGMLPGTGVFLVLLVGRDTCGRWVIFAFFLGFFVVLTNVIGTITEA